MWTERRTPQSVISVATSQDRGVAPGERIKYSHASSTKPRPQQTSAILASRSLTLRIQTEVAAARMVPSPMIAATALVIEWGPVWPRRRHGLTVGRRRVATVRAGNRHPDRPTVRPNESWHDRSLRIQA